jgi:uncharacterized membrane protein YvbJ
MPLEKTIKESHQGVACAKCGQHHTSRVNLCDRCGARLYIACRRCGHANQRVLAHCTECGQRLHRSPLSWNRIRKRLFGSRSKITLLQIILLAVSVVFTYKAIVYLAEYKPAAYESE